METLTVICTIVSMISLIGVISLYITIMKNIKQNKLIDDTLDYITKHL